MFALGRLFNLGLSATTANTRISLTDAGGVTIVAFGATSATVTVNEANAATGGTSQALPRITRYWTQNNGVWTLVNQAAASTFSTGAGGLAVAEIETTWLSDGFTHVSASSATATMLHVVRDMAYQRNPVMLTDVRV